MPWDPWGRGWAGLWAWMHRNHEEEPGNEEEEEMNDEDALAIAEIIRFNREMKEIKRRRIAEEGGEEEEKEKD